MKTEITEARSSSTWATRECVFSPENPEKAPHTLFVGVGYHLWAHCQNKVLAICVQYHVMFERAILRIHNVTYDI